MSARGCVRRHPSVVSAGYSRFATGKLDAARRVLTRANIQLTAKELDNVPLVRPWPCNALAVEILKPLTCTAWFAPNVLNHFSPTARFAAKNLNLIPDTARPRLILQSWHCR